MIYNQRIKALFLRHIYLIKGSLPRIIDLIYWPTIQIILWGFISKFFSLNASNLNYGIGVILSAAVLYDFLFRSSISFNMLFLEEIWSRNFTNLFVSPIKISEIIISLTFATLIRVAVGVVPAVLIISPLFGFSILDLGSGIIFLLLNLYVFGISLGLMVSAGLLRFGPSFENIAWSSLFLLAPIGCIYYPLSILPEWLQLISKFFPLMYIFETARGILLENNFNSMYVIYASLINFIYLIFSIALFYISYFSARKRGNLINIGE
jgi:ABC-2 type transport system permease protein